MIKWTRVSDNKWVNGYNSPIVDLKETMENYDFLVIDITHQADDKYAETRSFFIPIFRLIEDKSFLITQGWNYWRSHCYAEVFLIDKTHIKIFTADESSPGFRNIFLLKI